MDASLQPKQDLPAFNPFQPGFNENPYPHYHRLRQVAPILPLGGCLGTDWILTRYSDISSVLNDPRFDVDNLPERIHQRAVQSGNPQVKALSRALEHWLFFLNAPEHTRIRQLLTAAFSPPAVAHLKSEISRLANDLLGGVAAATHMDVIADLAKPLPCLVTATVLGVPPEDCGRLLPWSTDLFTIFNQPAPMSHYELLARQFAEFSSYLGKLIQQRKLNPRSDLLTRLASSNALRPDEVVSACAMLFSVGQETTQHLIGNGVHALLQNPAQLHFLRRNPHAMPFAMKELARHNTPVQMILRVAREDIELGGKLIKRGERLHLFLGAAHRDPEAFPSPDELNLARKGASGLLFGSGTHVCLGVHLALLEAGIAIGQLLRRFPKIALNLDRPIWIRSTYMRGLTALPIAFDSAEA